MNIGLIKKRIKFDVSAAEITKKRTLSRIQTMADAIAQQFPEVTRHEQIKLKHVFFIKNQWFLSEGFSDATTRDYLRSLTLMIAALGRVQHWLGPLGLQKTQQKGGRPVVASVVKSKSRLKRA